MYCHGLIDQKAAAHVVRSRNIVVLLCLLCFVITDRGFAQAPIDVVQPPIDVVEVPKDVFQAPSTTQFFEVDNDHTSLLFAVSHAGLSYTYGRFEKCSGQVLLNQNVDDSYFRFEIDVASINTNSRLRDDHLLSHEFFDAKKFPKITFDSTDVKRDAVSKNYIVTGMMSMHGVERKVEMPITMIGVGKGPMGKTRGGFATKFTFQRSDFGISSMAQVVGDQIAVTFSFEGVLEDAPLEIINRFTEKK